MDHHCRVAATAAHCLLLILAAALLVLTCSAAKAQNITHIVARDTKSDPGWTGVVNITDVKGGKVEIGAEDYGKLEDSLYVKSLKEIPYNISVVHISKSNKSLNAEAPTPSAHPESKLKLTDVMSSHGCKVFAATLSGTEAEKTYESNVDGGLTIFCPGDDAFKSFLPKYKNLTSEAKTSLLLYHAVPIYESIRTLKSSNGLTNTLATDGKATYDFTVQNDGEDVTLVTKFGTSRIIGTVIDKEPLVIYLIDEVLMPIELFKDELSPAPAPTPAAKKKKKDNAAKGNHVSPPKVHGKGAEAPADSPDNDVADQTADEKNDGGFRLGSSVVVALETLWLVFWVLF